MARCRSASAEPGQRWPRAPKERQFQTRAGTITVAGDPGRREQGKSRIQVVEHLLVEFFFLFEDLSLGLDGRSWHPTRRYERCPVALEVNRLVRDGGALLRRCQISVRNGSAGYSKP